MFIVSILTFLVYLVPWLGLLVASNFFRSLPTFVFACLLAVFAGSLGWQAMGLVALILALAFAYVSWLDNSAWLVRMRTAYAAFAVTSSILGIHHVLCSQACQRLSEAKKIVGVVQEVGFKENAVSKYKVSLKLLQVDNVPVWLPYNVSLFAHKNLLKVGQTVTITDFRFSSLGEQMFRQTSLGAVFIKTFYSCQWRYVSENLSIWDQLNMLKAKLLKKVSRQLSSTSQAFVALILLGYKDVAEATKLRELFCKWGISHYLARSGLHVALLACLWLLLGLALPIGIAWRYFFVLTLSLLFGLLSWSAVSFARAQIMFSLLLLGKIFAQRTDPLHFLQLAALFLIFSCPYSALGLDFQLSFGLVAGLLFFMRQQELEWSQSAS